MVDHTLQRQIASVAHSHGLDLPNQVLDRLSQFADLLLVWNQKINLVGFHDAAELVEVHFRDAFAAAQFISPGTRVIDVGSGGGLPAIPLAVVASEAQFVLCEPVTKKAAFLRTAVRELGLVGRVAVQGIRIDDRFDRRSLGDFDVAMARAVFSPAEWLHLGCTLVRPAGAVLVFTTEAGANKMSASPTALSHKWVIYGEGRCLVCFTTA